MVEWKVQRVTQCSRLPCGYRLLTMQSFCREVCFIKTSRVLPNADKFKWSMSSSSSSDSLLLDNVLRSQPHPEPKKGGRHLVLP